MTPSSPGTPGRAGPPPAPWTYGWWLAVGLLLGLEALGLLTIGGLFLLAAGALALIGVRGVRIGDRSTAAVPAGVGLAVLYPAWLNRDGAGTVCETDGDLVSCVEQWSPWPFVAVAFVLVAASVAVAVATRRR